jgi:hypothetical protein
MTLLQVVLEVAGAIAVVAVISLFLYVLVRWARKRQTRAYVIGAVLAPFMALGHIVDPEYRIVHEARQHKKQREGEPGDPPSDEDGEALDARPPEPPAPAPQLTRPLARILRWWKGAGG